MSLIDIIEAEALDENQKLVEIKRALDAGLEGVNQIGSSGENLFYKSVFWGYTKIVQYLLTVPNTEINETRNSWSPLHEAAAQNYVEIVRLLIGIPRLKVNKPTYFGGQTPLHQAASKGHNEIFKLLLAAPGIQVNQADTLGNTPLIQAVSNEHIEIVKLLLADFRTQIDQAGEFGNTPLHIAIVKGNTEMQKLLIAHGVNIYKKNDSGLSPFDLASPMLQEQIISWPSAVAAKQRYRITIV